MDADHYRALAAAAGFRVATLKEQGGGFRTFFLELHKA
jgi:hypothetical protein